MSGFSKLKTKNMSNICKGTIFFYFLFVSLSFFLNIFIFLDVLRICRLAKITEITPIINTNTNPPHKGAVIYHQDHDFLFELLIIVSLHLLLHEDF